MSSCIPDNDNFNYLPSVYLLTDPTKICYQLYVSVTLPAGMDLELRHHDLRSVRGGVIYHTIEATDPCPGPWVFQAVLPFDIEPGAPLHERQIGVQVHHETEMPTVIVHHADADEKADLPELSL